MKEEESFQQMKGEKYFYPKPHTRIKNRRKFLGHRPQLKMLNHDTKSTVRKRKKLITWTLLKLKSFPVCKTLLNGCTVRKNSGKAHT